MPQRFEFQPVSTRSRADSGEAEFYGDLAARFQDFTNHSLARLQRVRARNAFLEGELAGAHGVPKLKKGSSLSASIYNDAAMASYLASSKADMRQRVDELEQQHGRDPGRLDAALSGLREGMLKEIPDQRLRDKIELKFDDLATSALMRAGRAFREDERRQHAADLDGEMRGLADDVARLSRDGNIEAAEHAMGELENITAMVSASPAEGGLGMFEPAKAREFLESVQVDSMVGLVVGEMERQPREQWAEFARNFRDHPPEDYPRELVEAAVDEMTSVIEKHNRVDSLANAHQNEAAKVERAQRIADFRHKIDAETTDREIYDFATDEGIADQGTITAMLTKRDKALDSAALFNGLNDPTSSAVRERLDAQLAQLPADAAPEGIMEVVFSVAAETGITPKSLEAQFEIGARSETGFVEAAGLYQQFRERAPNAYLPLSDDAKALYSQAAVLSRGGMDPVEAANTAWAIVNNATPEIIQARSANYPGDEIRSSFESELNDIDGLNVPGLIWDSVAEMPDEMMTDVNNVAYAVYRRTGDREAALQAAKDAIPRVWQITDVNDDVKVGDDTLGRQYMKHAPLGDGKFLRKVLEQDLKGQQFLLGNALGPIDAERVEVYSPPLVERNEFDQVVYTLRVDGQLLLDESGQVVRWTPLENPNDKRARLLAEQQERQKVLDRKSGSIMRRAN